MSNETQSLVITRDQLVKVFAFWIEDADEKPDGYCEIGDMSYQEAAERSADTFIALLKQEQV